MFLSPRRRVGALSPVLAVLALQPAHADPADYFGHYVCQTGPSFALTATAYTQQGTAEAPIAAMEDGPYGLIVTLTDGYRFGLTREDGGTYSWMSGESGDEFTCTRQD